MSSVIPSATEAASPRFWRDESLPFIEARSIQDGRQVCYATHAHETFSIGAITGGRSTYVNGKAQARVGTGAVVVINPEEAHACNPIDDEPWAYCMLYVQVPWLGGLQHELGFAHGVDFQGFSATLSTQPALYAGLNALYAVLTDALADPLQKYSAALSYFSGVQQLLNQAPLRAEGAAHKLARAADYIRAHCTRSVKLDEICAAAELSPSYLIRAFKNRYGMTPHAYLINRRIEYSQAQLRRGRPIAEVALEAGFADQAHLQRAFRRLVAATPGQYRA